MTVPVSCPPPGPSSIDASSTLARKRRRRAPASGASDDCFACSKRNTKCDRRRPYCSQCLSLGNECSGYKTQLTWGVGVASRGKLRGLSLPVAKSAPAAKSPVSTRPRAASILAKQASQQTKCLEHDDDDHVRIKVENQASGISTPYTTYDFVNMVPNSPSSAMHATSVGPDWQQYPRSAHGSISEHSSTHGHLLRQSLQRLNTPNVSVRRRDDLTTPTSSSALSTYADSEYASPLDQAFRVDDVPFLASPATGLSEYSQNSPIDGRHYVLVGESRGPTSCPDALYSHSDMSSSLSSQQQATIYEEDTKQHFVGSPVENYSHSEVFYDDEVAAISANDSDQYMSRSHHSIASWPSASESEYGSSALDLRYRQLEALHLSISQEISPHLNFYLNYYEKVICPVTVAIDSASNPYRRQILQLAAESESVQHAICALSSCNIRMKRKNALEVSRWRRDPEFNLQNRLRRATNADDAEEEAAMAEEYHHRTKAVQLLNQHLSDPTYACHDAVLATLLILCHYRMAETGIAHFETQFAGAKKLMSMRSSGSPAGEWGWMDSAFTFFDAITATVNDREAQLRDVHLDAVVNSPTNESALENMAGCDARLFKTIGTLARLNLLSQNRTLLNPTSSSLATSNLTLPKPQGLTDCQHLNQQRFDGNGFSSTLDDNLLPSVTGALYPDDEIRAQFWHEWQATRTALEAWSFDPHRLAARLPAPPSGNQMRDFKFVSEAFRHAALLYTERLASPSMPRAATNFQNLVAKTLYYVGSLSEGSTAEKFLLWPLFIAGSEAVNEIDRNQVRAQCRGIAARGGYANNLAALDVLEKVWAEGEDEGRTCGGSPFRWTKIMDGVDGEFIMV